MTFPSDGGSYIILSPIELSIRRKIEAVGKPLKDWDVKIYRGVLTGCNEAFIITTEKRDELLAQCQTEEERQRTAELIRPILRGRDIKRYSYDWAGLWVINTHNGVKEEGIPPINIQEYPVLKAHLDQYVDKLEVRADKGNTPYNLRNCAYIKDFDRPKVMWKIIGCNINFAFDRDGMLCNNAVNIMTGDERQLLQFVALMNSRLFDWYLKLTTEAEVQGGGIQLYVTTLETTPLQLSFPDTFCDAINAMTKNEKTIADIECHIYELYGLTAEEITFLNMR